MNTGCFDLTCPGFVQTSHEIALGAAIYPISNPNGLPSEIIIYIHKVSLPQNHIFVHFSYNLIITPVAFVLPLSSRISTRTTGGCNTGKESTSDTGHLICLTGYSSMHRLCSGVVRYIAQEWGCIHTPRQPWEVGGIPTLLCRARATLRG